MRHFIAYAEQEGGLYQRPRLQVKARLAPMRLHGRWTDDELLLHARPALLRRPPSVWHLRRAKQAMKAVTHHGSLWFREQYRRTLGRF